MKFQVFLISLLLIPPIPAVAQSVRVYGECYRNIEEYVPGYYTSSGQYMSGYVRTRRESTYCGSQGDQQYQSTAQTPTARCGARNTTLGALLGGGIAYLVTGRKYYSSSIPVGAVLGAVFANKNCY